MRSTKEMKLHERWKEKNEQRVDRKRQKRDDILKMAKKKKEKVKQDV